MTTLKNKYIYFSALFRPSSIATMSNKSSNRTPRRRTNKPDEVPCIVDRQLLDTLIHSLQVLRGNRVSQGPEDGGEDAEGGHPSADPTNLNNILHHILTAVNDLAANVREMRKEFHDLGEEHRKVVPVLEKRATINEDETDECRQRSLKGNFIISSVANSAKQKVSLIKTDEQLTEDGETLDEHIIDLAKQKYGVEIRSDEVQACHRLPNNQVILRMWKRTSDSSWAKMSEGIKSGRNPGFNVYFNFQLTKKRVGLLYELRQMKRDGKVHKFLTDENGQISAVRREGERKQRLTYFSMSRGCEPSTYNILELREFVDKEQLLSLL